MRKAPSLDTAVNALLAITCLVVLGKYAHEWWRGARTIPSDLTQTMRQGSKVTGIDSVVWKDRNILLFARSTCQFCTESMPFYRDLREQTHDSGVGFIAAGDEPRDIIEAYLRSHGLRPDDVVSAPLRETRIRATPTLAIIDKQGTVIEAWVGRLSPDKEAKVKSMFIQRQ